MTRDETIGHQINCAICGAFIAFEYVGGMAQVSKPCPNGCTIPCRSPKFAGIITNMKLGE